MNKQLLRTWLLTIVVVTVPFWGILVGTETALIQDVVAYHLPTMTWVADRLVDGHLPEWGQWSFGGQNVIGIGQGAVFYPFTLLFGIFGPVLGYRIWLILHLWIATTGAFVWSWRTWHSRAGALISGVGYGLNGFLILHLGHMNFTIGSAWLPWMLIGIDLLHAKWGVRRAAAVAVPVALIGVSGHPQMLWFAVVTASVYALGLLARRDIPWRATLRTAGRLAGAGALGLGLAAICLVPQYMFSRTSVRSTPTTKTAFELASEPRHLFTTVFPYLMGGGHDVPGVDQEWLGGQIQHEVSTHTGIVIVALAVFGLVATIRRRRTIALTVLMLFAVTTAIADVTPIGPLAFHLVPMADAFRAWGRNMVMFNLAASLLAGAGVTAILQATDRRRKVFALVAAATTLWLINVSVLSDLGGALVPARRILPALAVPVFCIAIALGAVLLARRYPRPALAVIAAASAFDMAFFAYGAGWRANGMPAAVADDYFDHGLGEVGTPVDAPGGIDRWVSNFTGLHGLAIVNDTSSIFGYDPLIQSDWAEVTGMTYVGTGIDGRLRSEGWFADVLRVTTGFITGRVTPTRSWERVESAAHGFRVYVREPRLAEAYVVGRVEVETGLARITERLRDTNEDFREMVLLEHPNGSFIDDIDPEVSAEVLGAMNDDGTGQFTVTSDGRGVLVISTPWLDGWEATVNGKPVEIERANGLVLAIPVGPGTNEVRLEFHSPGLTAGAAVTGLSGLTLLGLGAVELRRRRRQAGAPEAMADEPAAGEPSDEPTV